MFDTHAGVAARGVFPIIQDVEFLRIDLVPLNDGKVCVTLTATTVDEEEPQLLDQEVARARAVTIDDVLGLIRTHVLIDTHTRARLSAQLGEQS